MEDRVKALEDALRLSEARVSAVSVKLPPFWPEKAKLWFAQAEAQFDIKNITVEKTKYSHIVSMLDSKAAEFAMDIIENPPAEDPYKVLKARLTGAYSISDDEKAERLLDMNGLGDKTPSQCMSSMLMLVPEGQDPGFLFRKIFLRQLPTEVQTHLAQTSKVGTKAADLRELALEADKYFATAGSRISSVQGSTDCSLEAEIDAVATRGGRTLCFYHKKFGDRATKCRQPCSFKPNTSSTNPRPGNYQSGRRLSN